MSNNPSRADKVKAAKAANIVEQYAKNKAKREKIIQKETEKMKKAIESRTSKIDAIIKKSEKIPELCNDKLATAIRNNIKQETVDVKIPLKLKVKTAIGLVRILKNNIKKLKGEKHVYSYQISDINTNGLTEKEKFMLTQATAQLETNPKGQWNLREETKETIIKRFTNDFTHDCQNYLNNVMGKAIVFDDPIEIDLDRQKVKLTSKAKIPEYTTPKKLAKMFKNDKGVTPRKWDDGTITFFSIEDSLQEELDNAKENWDEGPVVEIDAKELGQQLEQHFTAEILPSGYHQVQKDEQTKTPKISQNIKPIKRK